MPMYNLVEYSYNYSKTSGSLWRHYKDKPSLTDAGVINSFFGNSILIKFKQKDNWQNRRW